MISSSDGITPRRGSRVFSTDDARRLAARRQPRIIFDFIEGAAGREVAVGRNSKRFDELMLRPRVMADVANRDLTTKLFGQTFGLPLGIAPMGMCDLAWPGADRAMATAARQFGLPVCLSSAASSSIEDMADWAGENAWFQLYVSQTIEQAEQMVARARAAGYKTLILTVDVPQVSRRLRDLRNGFAMPFRIGPRQFLDFALHPKWSLTTLFSGVPRPRNFILQDGSTGFDRAASRAGADWAFLERLRALWDGTLIVKGVTSAEDAIRIRTLGADAIYVSTHGGRQLDSAPAAIDLLPVIREALGPEMQVIFDSGVRNGEDVVKALASGADFVMIGRPVLFALGAEGPRGVPALLDCFREEISTTLAQIGLANIPSVTSDALYHPSSELPQSETIVSMRPPNARSL